MMARSPRERMVVSMALLIKDRGGAAISDVLQHSGAPRGSAYHYFPGGRTQLLCEAVDLAGNHIATTVSRAESSLALLDTILDLCHQQLVATNYRARCPIVAVSLEPVNSDQDAKTSLVIDHAAAVFTRWVALITQRFLADGITDQRAEELAVLTVSAIEGAILLARVRRDPAALDIAGRYLHDLVQTEVARK
jgi:AcrR family transcriptional regulator